MCLFKYADLLRVTEWFLEEITISASTTRPRCNVESECPVGAMEMARKTLSLPRMSYFQLKELSEFKNQSQSFFPICLLSI